MRLPRSSGILLHPTSLPGPYGIGDLGPPAEAFLDFLSETGQKWWQMLPVGPTGPGNSPYSSTSSYAGTRLLLSPDKLFEANLISRSERDDYPSLSENQVDYDAVFEAKERLLRLAFSRFLPDENLEEFQARASTWLHDYSLYMALKTAFNHQDWMNWDVEISRREPVAMVRWRQELDEEVRYHEFVQFLFDQQWNNLRELCRQRDIGLIGDLPIFVAQDSADVWARPDLFRIDEQGKPTEVAGVPPDYFNEDGQLWGNPLYRWETHANEQYAWWVDRLRGQTDRFDLVRLDHFRGFEAYFSVPADAETAADPRARWELGPGAGLLRALKTAYDDELPLIAEDLGVITFEVEALRDQFELPGMRVLQFAFGDDPLAAVYLPHNSIQHCIVYTGTHDNDTTLGWFTAPPGSTTQSAELLEAERRYVRRYLGTDGQEVHWDFIRLASGSIADTAIFPMQDVLGLGSEARMNIPGKAMDNWTWRYQADQLTKSARQRLADITAIYDRFNGEIPDFLQLPRKSRPRTEETYLGR